MNEFQQIIDDIMNGKRNLSYSALSSFLKSPKHFYRYKMEKKVTDAMEAGKMFHMAVLEPEKFKKEYWVLDDAEKCAEIGGAKPRATKKYKEWLVEHYQTQGGQMISASDYETFMDMSEAISTNPSTKPIMDGLTATEEKFEYETDGFKFVGYKDGVGEDEEGKYLIDLKKVANADFNKVKWTIRDNNYDMQAGLYCKASGVNRFKLIFIDNDCNITVVNLLPETLEAGYNKFEYAIQSFQMCAETDAWMQSYDFYNGGFVNY